MRAPTAVQSDRAGSERDVLSLTSDSLSWPEFVIVAAPQSSFVHNDEPSGSVLRTSRVGCFYVRLGEASAAAGTSSLEAACECLERRRLRQTEDRPECQRGAVGVVAVCDPADGVAENLNGRLGYMF